MRSSATYFNGSGMYGGDQKTILYVVVPNYRLIFLKKLIREIDANAFIVVHNVKDVSGGTFLAPPVSSVEEIYTEEALEEEEENMQAQDEPEFNAKEA